LKDNAYPFTSAAQLFGWLLWPMYAWAAGEALSLESLSAWTYAVIAGASVLGFLISSAEDVFGWLDARETRALGRLVARFAAALVAGFTAYWLGRLAGAVEIYALLAVTPAAAAGEKYLGRLADKKSELDAGRIR
jgi:hypothetical protein